MPATKRNYVHGYSSRENERLMDQATTLTDLLHHDTRYPSDCLVLEAGCGIGAQTVTLAQNSPTSHFISIDISQASLDTATKRAERAGVGNVSFQQADIFNLPFPNDHFDHIFVCFVLEHLSDPLHALFCLKKTLKTGGTITVIEGDHGSTYYHPDSGYAWQTIQCLIDLQDEMGGNALIGRQLFPLLSSAEFFDIRISPRMVYVDASRPRYVEGFTKNTFIAMVEGIREQAISAGMIDAKTWEKGIQDLYRTTEPDGIFCYTFFKGVAIK